GEPPGVRADRAHPVLDQVLEIAVVLLQMVLSEEQPLGPRDLAVPGHCGVEPPALTLEKPLRNKVIETRPNGLRKASTRSVACHCRIGAPPRPKLLQN